jgi:hypothetical protein
MAAFRPGPLSGPVGRFASRLRFPQLFTFFLIVFVVDLVVPDVIPFADEILFGLLTVILGSLRRREPKPRSQAPPEERVEKNVTPPKG